jgi:hypothetical protein
MTIDLRHQRPHLARLRRATFSNVVRTLHWLGLCRLRNLEPKPLVIRYEWDCGRPEPCRDKDPALVPQGGHRPRVRSAAGPLLWHGVGYDNIVHVSDDQSTRLGQCRLARGSAKLIVISFLSRPNACFNSQGIEWQLMMSHYASAYGTRAIAMNCEILVLKLTCIYHCMPRRNAIA